MARLAQHQILTEENCTCCDIRYTEGLELDKDSAVLYRWAPAECTEGLELDKDSAVLYRWAPAECNERISSSHYQRLHHSLCLMEGRGYPVCGRVTAVSAPLGIIQMYICWSELLPMQREGA